MNDMSMRITPWRQASCSAFQLAQLDGLPNVSGSWSGADPSGVYQSAPSQPLTSLNQAPRATNRSWIAERLAPRAVTIERLG